LLGQRVPKNAKIDPHLCILRKNKIGKENYYFNDDLIDLLINVGNLKKEEETADSIITENE